MVDGDLDNETLRCAGIRIREHLEPVWRLYKEGVGKPMGPTVSAGMCRHSAVFASRALAHAGVRCVKREIGRVHWSLGTDPEAARREISRRPDLERLYMPAHVWLAIGDGRILDLTADQFGGPEVFAGPREDYLPHMIDPSATDTRSIAKTAISWEGLYGKDRTGCRGHEGNLARYEALLSDLREILSGPAPDGGPLETDLSPAW